MEKRNLKSGQYVTITNQTLDGKSFLEGTAELIKLLRKDPYNEFEQWLVRFSNGDEVARIIEL